MSITALYRGIIVRKYLKTRPQDFLPEESARIREAVRKFGSGSEVFPIDTFLVCVCRQERAESRQEAESLISRIRAAFPPGSSDSEVLFAVGNAFPVRQLDFTFRQAREVADLIALRTEPAPGDVFWFQDLLLPSVLITISQNKRDLLRSSIVSRLEEYDSQHGGELLGTLETYLACGRNISQTARKLFIHRNTLLFRMERIQEILGFSLEDPDILLIAEIALRLRAYR